MTSDTYQNYIKHLDSIITMFENAPKDSGWITESAAQGVLARAESAIHKICNEDSPYRTRVKSILKQAGVESFKADLVVGIVRALKGELEDGYLNSFPELVRGELFKNFIDMAEHLLDEGFKDAAAVIAGSSLESHLRRLCIKHFIPVQRTANGATIHKKAEALNQELGKTAYSLFDQKQITTWLHLRNDAAHGNYSNYSEDQVARLIEWVRDFIVKNPA